jgi:hypothetical protein
MIDAKVPLPPLSVKFDNIFYRDNVQKMSQSTSDTNTSVDDENSEEAAMQEDYMSSEEEIDSQFMDGATILPCG